MGIVQQGEELVASEGLVGVFIFFVAWQRNGEVFLMQLAPAAPIRMPVLTGLITALGEGIILELRCT